MPREASDSQARDPWSTEVVLPSDAEAAWHARAWVRETLALWRRSDLEDTATLVASELVTNALVHGEGRPLLRLMLTDTLLMEVTDEGAGLPMAHEVDMFQTRGRGLMLVQAVAKEWGCRQATTHKTVWCELEG